jgi:NodT family efflux transporter outer membrane factor (OMF) lipoprotein
MKSKSTLSRRWSPILIGLGLFLGGCAVGPGFQSPSPPKTTAYVEGNLPLQTEETTIPGGAAQTFVSGKDIPGEWWRLFHSRPLDALIKRALHNSPTLAAAQAACQQAEENLNVAVAAFLPSLTFQPQYQRSGYNYSALGLESVIPARTFNLFGSMLNASYTLDVWGGIRRQIEAAKAQRDFQEFINEATYSGLVANVVMTAISEASLEEQVKVIEKLLSVQETELSLIEEKFKAGVVSSLEVLAAKNKIFVTKSSLCSLRLVLAKIRHSLAVLIGDTPHEATLPSFRLADFHLPQDLPVSLPSELVKQRPDIRAAEEVLHAASAQVGVATANLLPQITISGFDGFLSNSLSGYFQQGNVFWNLTTGLVQPIFKGGALLAQQRQALALFDQACAEYKTTVLKAIQSVADNLRALQLDAENLGSRTQEEETTHNILDLTRSQLALGAVDTLSVLQIEEAYLQVSIKRIQAQAERFVNTAALFYELGGGWWNRKKKEENK